MSNELKPCPFCGELYAKFGKHQRSCFMRIIFDYQRKILTEEEEILFDRAWNTRPEEDRLRAELEEVHKTIAKMRPVIDAAKLWYEAPRTNYHDMFFAIEKYIEEVTK